MERLSLPYFRNKQITTDTGIIKPFLLPVLFGGQLPRTWNGKHLSTATINAEFDSLIDTLTTNTVSFVERYTTTTSDKWGTDCHVELLYIPEACYPPAIRDSLLDWDDKTSLVWDRLTNPSMKRPQLRRSSGHTKPDLPTEDYGLKKKTTRHLRQKNEVEDDVDDYGITTGRLDPTEVVAPMVVDYSSIDQRLATTYPSKLSIIVDNMPNDKAVYACVGIKLWPDSVTKVLTLQFAMYGWISSCDDRFHRSGDIFSKGERYSLTSPEEPFNRVLMPTTVLTLRSMNEVSVAVTVYQQNKDLELSMVGGDDGDVGDSGVGFPFDDGGEDSSPSPTVDSEEVECEGKDSDSDSEVATKIEPPLKLETNWDNVEFYIKTLKNRGYYWCHRGVGEIGKDEMTKCLAPEMNMRIINRLNTLAYLWLSFQETQVADFPESFLLEFPMDSLNRVQIDRLTIMLFCSIACRKDHWSRWYAWTEAMMAVQYIRKFAISNNISSIICEMNMQIDRNNYSLLFNKWSESMPSQATDEIADEVIEFYNELPKLCKCIFGYVYSNVMSCIREFRVIQNVDLVSQTSGWYNNPEKSMDPTIEKLFVMIDKILTRKLPDGYVIEPTEDETPPEDEQPPSSPKQKKSYSHLTVSNSLGASSASSGSLF